MTETDRRRFMQELGAELDAVDAQLDQYRSKFREARDDSQQARRIEELERRRAELKRRSEQLEDFDGDQWLDAKREIEQARLDLEATLARVRRHPEAH